METDAFLVLGAESSGTKFLTRILMDGGCVGEDGNHQRFDNWQQEGFGAKKPIVWRRSFPWHTTHLWPNVELDLLKPLKKNGFQSIMAIVISRDWHSLWQSQTRQQQHAPTEEAALENICIAHLEIFEQLKRTKLPFLVVTYEALAFFGSRAVRPLLKKLELDDNAGLSEIKNDLAKYYPEPP